MKLHNTIASIVLVAIFLPGCAVYKAASNDGIAVSDIKSCQSKMCFMSQGMELVDKQQGKGSYTEVYRAVARKSGLNYVRAAGHGVLDVATLGLWEVAGTPVEGAISNNRGYITVKAIYSDKEAVKPEKVEIYAANGQMIGDSSSGRMTRHTPR